MYVVGGGQYQFIVSVIVWQCGVWMQFVFVQGDNFVVLNFYGLVCCVGLYCYVIFVVKIGFQQYVIEIVMWVSDFYGVVCFVVQGVSYCCMGEWYRGIKQCGGGDYFIVLVQKFMVVIVFFYFMFLCFNNMSVCFVVQCCRQVFWCGDNYFFVVLF